MKAPRPEKQDIRGLAIVPSYQFGEESSLWSL